MKDVTNDPAALAEAADAEDWRLLMEDIAEERGYFDALGDAHAALFSEAGDTLIVTFENAETIRGARAQQQPLGWALTRGTDWSSLVLLSEGRTWFRDPHVYAYFDRLVDDGFFDEYDRIVFVGAGAEGYAAAAFSVVALDVTVLTFAPQATLDTAVAGWDRRHPAARRRDFTSRYGYAPDMIEAAAAAWVFYDPSIAEDAMHATLFGQAGARTVAVPDFGADPARLVEDIGALDEIVGAAVAGRLSRATVARALRRRRDSLPYLRRLLARVQASQSPDRVIRLCHAVLRLHAAPRFRKALAQAEQTLAETGRETGTSQSENA